ncbi:hypothetical protein Y032_0031g2270 [Ancylostoma ceylanicum]|nr:hypothetical protein Y032_0031g2270 [Ancylostoma ceylanicum]
MYERPFRLQQKLQQRRAYASTNHNPAAYLLSRSLFSCLNATDKVDVQVDGTVNMVVERAVEPAAQAQMESYLTASQYQAPSVAMASDVKSIVRRYFDKLKMGHGNMKPVTPNPFHLS